MITYTQLMEGASVKSTMSDLNKKMSLLKTDVKGGNINDIITRLMSIEIFMGKAIKDLNKLVKESVEYETDLDSLFEEELREAKWKLTSMSAKDAIKKYGKDKVRVGHLKMRDKSTSVEINEAVSMKNAKGIGFGKKGGYDKYVTLAKKKNAKSHKDVLKVLSREGLGKEELDNVADYVMNALGESVELGEAVLDEGVSSEAKSVMREINKHLKILKTELKTSDENQDWKARLNRIEGIIGKVKWTVEESVDLEEGVSLLKKGKYELTADGKSSVGVTLSLRHKGKQIITGTKKDGMFIMAFEKHNVRNKLPKGAEIVKKGKWMHIGFKKADDVIAYAKGQGFVADNKGVAESLVMQLVAKLKEK